MKQTRIPAVVATATAAAALFHVLAAGHHLNDAPGFAALFVATAVVQMAAAVAAQVRPTRGVFGATIVVNGGALFAWGWSRTFGLPFGPHAGSPEAVGVVDAATATVEVAAIFAAMAAARSPKPALRAARPVLVPMLSATVLATAMVGASFGDGGDAHRPHPINANEGYGQSQVVRFGYFQQYVCVTDPLDDLDGVAHNGDGLKAAQDPDEFQVPPCIVGKTPSGSLPLIDPEGDPAAQTEPVWVIVPFFDADHDGIIDAEDPEPGVDTQCPEPGPPYTKHTGVFATCSMHPSLLHAEPAGLADVPLPNHSHIVDGTNFGRIWWKIISVRVFDERVWPNFNGRCPARPAGGPPCLTSLEALRAAQRNGRAGPDVGTNLFLFFDSRTVELDG